MENKKKVVVTEPDVAYQILREQKAPMHYRDLIAAVLERMGQDTAISGSRLAQIHTEINLDSRFDFLGKGMWGLQAWAPKPAARRSGADGPNERSYQPKAADYLWDEEEPEDIEEDEDGFIPDDEDIDTVDTEDEEEEEGEDALVIDDLLDEEAEDLDEGDEDDDPENA